MYKLTVNGNRSMKVVESHKRLTKLDFHTKEELELFLTVVFFMSDISIGKLFATGYINLRGTNIEMSYI